MWNSNFYQFFILIVTFGCIASACNDDDDQPNPPAQQSYPVTFRYHETTDKEFRMWTAGAEVSTVGLNLEDFMEPEDYLSLHESNYLNAEFTLTTDTIIISDETSSESRAYYFKNDSLYLEINDFFGYNFFATGDLNGLVYAQGYVGYCWTSQGGQFSSCNMQLRLYSHDLESALEEFNLNSVSDIGESDTLLIFNQKHIFKPL